ncbi:unnamed protein product [Rotaria sp. Silwood1]|nr:unnamed protein product [Rotaria sp. Silwood1]
MIEKGVYDDALAILTQDLNIYESLSTVEHDRIYYHDIAAFLSNIARCYLYKGEHDLAITFFNRAYDTRESNYSSDHFESAYDLDQLGSIFTVKVLSYNQPKFSSNASWNPNAIKFADINTVGSFPWNVFVNINNTVYVTATNLHEVKVWSEGRIIPTTIISNGLSSPLSLFVTINGDIYVGNSKNGRVDMWTQNTTDSIPAMYVRSPCFSLFVDIKNTLYCSLQTLHQVIKRSLNSISNVTTIAAGNGSAGSASNMLSSPRGIFVDTKFNLYVADCVNNRIQCFQVRELNGKTVAGNGAPSTITLSCPSGIVLDGDGNLFIVDKDNHRIIESGENGFRCVVGCHGKGSAPNQLSNPTSLSFDSYGNIFVTDRGNSRIQKIFFINIFLW